MGRLEKMQEDEVGNSPMSQPEEPRYQPFRAGAAASAGPAEESSRSDEAAGCKDAGTRSIIAQPGEATDQTWVTVQS